MIKTAAKGGVRSADGTDEALFPWLFVNVNFSLYKLIGYIKN